MEIWKRSLGGGGKDSEGGDRKGCERGRLSRYDVLTGWRRSDKLPAGGGIKVESDQRLKPYQAVKARPLTLLVPAPRPGRVPVRGRAPSGVKSVRKAKRSFFHQTGTHETRSRERRAL
jgi:hypothetical protein